MSLRAIFALLAVVFSVIVIGVIGIVLIRRSPSLSDFSFTGSRGGEWKLELYQIGSSGNSGGQNFNYVTNKTSGEIHFETSESGSVSGSDLFQFFTRGSSSAGITVSGTVDALITISGQAQGGQLKFTPTFEGKNCDITASGLGITTKSDCANLFGTGAVTGEQGTIALENSTETTTTYTVNVDGVVTSTYHWRLTQLSGSATTPSADGCREDIPEIRSDVEQLLDVSISAGETPEQTHDKLTALAAEKYPINNIFKKDGRCFKVVGASVDLMYRIGSDENSIFRTVGDVADRATHHIVSATIDRMVTRDGRETQIYYQTTIDVVLDES